ncbi:MAG: transcriptional regulator [Betaproteobacteria bacterium]|nr:transcriptional regulator [Betaproteobacteria bacterium]
MLTVIETPEFIAATAQFWSDAEREEFIDWIAENPDVGDVIPGAKGLRKLRWFALGKGKRSGARVIYIVRTARGDLVLVTAYTKGRIENIPANLLRSLMEKYDV